METSSSVRANVVRSFTAQAETVFDAWLTSKQVASWMFGPAVRDEEIVSILLNPQVGGKFAFAVLRNGRRIDHIGEYVEIDRPKRLVFTWGVKQGGGANSRVEIDIASHEGSGCELRLTHEMPSQWADYIPQVTDSWTKMLDSLARSLI